MTLKVELEADVAARLRARARAEGLSLEEFSTRALGAVARAEHSGTCEGADKLEWLRDFHGWVQGHSTNTPLLSDETTTREFIYSERGL